MHWAVADTTKDNGNCGSLSYKDAQQAAGFAAGDPADVWMRGLHGFPPRVTDRSEDLKALQKHIYAAAITECSKR